MRRTANRKVEVEDDYLRLVNRFPVRRIRSAAEHAAASELIAELMRRGDDALSRSEADYLGALAHFVDEYERRNLSRTAGTPLERLRFLVEQSGLGQRGLTDLLGSESAASMLLSGRREPSKSQVRKLSRRFKLDAGYFL